MKLGDIQLYIDSGWRTIPYQSILYNEEGRKVAAPSIAWAKYRDVYNTEASPAGALICGDVLVIDCDTEEAARVIIKEAKWPGISTPSDLLNSETADSVGLVVKTKRGYHFYFKGDPDIEDCKGPKIDVQATEKKIVYLATNENASEGKKIIACDRVYEDGKFRINLHEMTPQLKSYILSLKDSKEEQLARKSVRYTGGYPLAKVEKGSTQFYKRLTPKSIASIPEYRAVVDKRGYLHPDDIKEGDGNSYMVAVAGILSTDPTVDVNVFWEFLEFINDQWTNPLSHEELVRKVKGYVENRYEDCPFNYDEDWEKNQYSFEDVDGNNITMVYDLATSKYLAANLDTGKVYIKGAADVATYYANRTGCKLSAANLATMLPGVTVIFDPLRRFGLHETKEFNVYRHSKYLDILNGEASYSVEEIEESKQCLALPFFEHLFKEQYYYWMSFLKRKLTKFEYSSTVFCLFDMEGGAGKGALESYLSKFVGKDGVGAISYETFKAKFTSDIEGKLFVFLNEYPEEYKERRKNTDRIKEMTGTPVAKIEKKGVDPYEAPNLATYMVTSNRVSVEIREGDRRFCVSNCDQKFDKVFGGRSYFNRMIADEEMVKLAVYLKYCVNDLNDKDFMQPPSSIAKEVFLDENETVIDKVVRALVEQDWETLLAIDESIIIAQYDVVDLSAIASALRLDRSTPLTKEINKQFRLKGVDIKKGYDRNHKYRVDRVITFLQYPEGSMASLMSDNKMLGATSKEGTKI